MTFLNKFKKKRKKQVFSKKQLNRIKISSIRDLIPETNQKKWRSPNSNYD